MPRVGLVLGAGGLVGQAYEVAVLAGLSEAIGWDARTADLIVGSSAGSLTGALLRLGLSPADLAAFSLGGAPSSEAAELFDLLGGPDAVEFPVFDLRGLLTGAWRGPSLRLLGRTARRPWRFRPGVAALTMLPAGEVDLLRHTEALDVRGNKWPDGLWICAARRDDGGRVVFGRPGAPPAALGAAVGASCAIPGYFAPVSIGGVEYFDGGVHSATSADVLAGSGLDIVIAISPMSAAHGRDTSISAPLRIAAHRRLVRELGRLRRESIQVIAFEPTAAVRAAMGHNPTADDRAPAVFDAVREELADRLRSATVRERLRCLETVIPASAGVHALDVA